LRPAVARPGVRGGPEGRPRPPDLQGQRPQGHPPSRTEGRVRARPRTARLRPRRHRRDDPVGVDRTGRDPPRPRRPGAGPRHEGHGRPQRTVLGGRRRPTDPARSPDHDAAAPAARVRRNRRETRYHRVNTTRTPELLDDVEFLGAARLDGRLVNVYSDGTLLPVICGGSSDADSGDDTSGGDNTSGDDTAASSDSGDTDNDGGGESEDDGDTVVLSRSEWEKTRERLRRANKEAARRRAWLEEH